MGKNVVTIPATISRHTSAPITSRAKRRVAAYARVSTEQEEQLNSYEAQVTNNGLKMPVARTFKATVAAKEGHRHGAKGQSDPLTPTIIIGIIILLLLICRIGQR